jgi:hypothetical protein
MDGIVPMTGASHTVTVQNDRNGKAFGIKLTDGSIKDPQFSGIVFDRLSFSSKRGFSIQFEYSMFDGKKAYGEYGDGFALVLYDPKGLTNGIPDTGSAGSALGYGGVLNDKGEGAGLSNGYLGIAFDQFGNNKWRRNQPDKDKPNKSQYSTGIKRSSVDVTYYSPSFLTVRGPMHPTIGRKGGYPVLLAQATHNIIETNKGKNRAVLNSSTGGYDWFNNAPSKDFIIRGDKLTDNPKDTEYRKAYVELLPGVHKGKKGYYLNVSIQAGCDPSGKYNIYSMTDFYFMSTEDEIIYMELDSRDRTNDVKQRLRLTPPSVFNLGFTAATGAAYQTQVIKDVKIALPFSPQATDNVYSDVCNGRVGYFNPILNDVGYNTNIIVDRAMPEGKFEYLDLESFRFMKPDGKGVYHPAGTAPYHKLEAPGGTFHYDKNTGIITFVPKAPYFTKDEDLEYELYYDIKNKPSELTGNLLSHDDYRSPISKVTFEFQKCPSVIVNPHITSSPKIKKTVR